MEDFFGFILYPVSAILWFWHKVFGAVLGPQNGFAWVLAVFFLVFTLRVLLLKPALSQIRAGRKMQKFAPQIQKLREKHKNDRQRMAQEMQKLQSEQGVNPLGGCLPALVQIPVFLSLFHVLRNFDPNAQSNFVFGRQGVESFINADIFGAKLSNWITQPSAVLQEFGTTRAEMIAVGVPLMIVASIATYYTMRMSMRRQTDASMANPQSAMIGKAMMYLAPIGALISGWFLPLAVLVYWLANNVWTLGQQHFLSNKVDREQEREREKEIAAKKEAPRPKPGQKPAQSGNGVTRQSDDDAEGATADDATADDARADDTRVDDADVSGDGTDGQPAVAGGKQAADKPGNASGAKTNGRAGGRPGGGPGGKKTQQKNRPGKQAAARKSQKKRR